MLTHILSAPAAKKDKWSFPLPVGISRDQVWWSPHFSLISSCEEAKFHSPLIEDGVSDPPPVKNWEKSPLSQKKKKRAPQEIQVLVRRESTGNTKEAIDSLTPSGGRKKRGGPEHGRKLQGREEGHTRRPTPQDWEFVPFVFFYCKK